ncbi:MAG: PAS domain-containing protein, partial [Candidatus Hydrogenedentes bacterium]|nr:PAS domain-containing protein [Candidatus Hydrogenedentota bacterium]
MDFSHPPLDDMDYIRQEALGFAGIGLLRVAASGVIASVDETALKVLDVAHRGGAPYLAPNSKLPELTACPIPVDRLVSELRRSARIRREEVSFLASDGTERWVQFDCYLVRDPESGKEYLQFVLQDVTQRRRALQLDRIRQMAIDSSISPVAMADLDGTITYANEALAGLWGYG